MEENAPKLIEEISQSDWEKTPESVKRLVANLMARTLAIRAAIRGIQKPERSAARAGAAKQQEYI